MGNGTLKGTIVKGSAGGGGTAATTSFEPTATITSENVQAAIEEVDSSLSDITKDIAAISGLGGYINSYDFGTATPTQQALTDYALTQIPNITALEVFNGTRVKNLFDNHIWILTNTPNTIPPVFEWADNGFDTVGIASNTVAGLVKGRATNGGLTIASDGTAAVTGFNTKYDKSGGVLSGDISIERASSDTPSINLKSGTVNSILSANSSGIFLYRTYNNRLAYDNSANKWYVYKVGVAKELGLTDASEISYSGTLSSTTVKNAIEEVDAKTEAVAGDLADTEINGVAIAGKNNTCDDLGIQGKLTEGSGIKIDEVVTSPVKFLMSTKNDVNSPVEDISGAPLGFLQMNPTNYVLGPELYANSTIKSIGSKYVQYSPAYISKGSFDWSKLNMGTGPFTVTFRRLLTKDSIDATDNYIIYSDRRGSSYDYGIRSDGSFWCDYWNATAGIPIIKNVIEEIKLTRLEDGTYEWYKNGTKLGTDQNILKGLTVDFSFGKMLRLGDMKSSYPTVGFFISGLTITNTPYTGGNYTLSEDYPTTGVIVTTNTISAKCYFGEIYTADNSTAQTIPTGATYTKSTAFNTAGEYRGVTLDAANNKIILPSAGYYRVGVTGSSKLGSAGITLKTALFLNGVKVPNCQAIRKVNNANDESTVSFGGIVKVDTANSEIDVRVAHDQGGDISLTTVFCNLNALYIGDLSL